MAEAGKVVLAVGIDHGNRVRQPLGRLVVVEHDHVEAELSGFRERLMTDRAAVDGDDEARPVRGEGGHRLDVGAIPFRDPVGNVDDRLAAAGLEIFADERRAARAVDVVVAEDRDPLAPLDRRLEPYGRRLHVAEHERVGHQVAHRRVEVAIDRLRRDVPPREHAGDQFILSADLTNGEGAHLPRPVESRPPRPAEGGEFDVEKITLGIHAVALAAAQVIRLNGRW